MTKIAEQIKQNADQAWESLSDGWRDLSSRASGALTRFWPVPQSTKASTTAPRTMGSLKNSWAFLASDIFESDDKIVIRIEAPGMRKEDFNVSLNGDVLTVWGEKHIDRDLGEGQWRVVQSAYGNFRREVALPYAVQVDKTLARYKDGILRIELPKSPVSRSRRVEVRAV